MGLERAWLETAEREKIWWPGEEKRSDGWGGYFYFLDKRQDNERVMEMKRVGYNGLIFFHF